MKIRLLSLKNFRNYAEEEFSFADGINILTGANAQGKTNAAEALFFFMHRLFAARKPRQAGY